MKCQNNHFAFKIIFSLQDLSKSAVLMFANKQDVDGCMSAAEISKELNLTSIKTHRWQIQSCCALTGEGLGCFFSNFFSFLAFYQGWYLNIFLLCFYYFFVHFLCFTKAGMAFRIQNVLLLLL